MKAECSIRLRIQFVAFSVASFVVATACSMLRLRSTPEVMCYEAVNPTDTPEPVVLCYEMVDPTATATSTPLASPLSTPTLTPTAEARRQLRDRLVAEGRLPRRVADYLSDHQRS